MSDHPALTPLALALATLFSLMAQLIKERSAAAPPPEPAPLSAPAHEPLKIRLEEIERKAQALERAMRHATQRRAALERLELRLIEPAPAPTSQEVSGACE
jgi:hypothetical protein